MWLSIAFHISTPVSFHLLGAGFIEKGGHPVGESPEVRDGSPMFGDLWLRENGSGSGQLRGGGFLWAPEGSNVAFLHLLSPPPHKKVCHTPSATISHLPPQESQEPKAPGPAEQALKLTSSTAPSFLEGEIPANMQPLHIQLGASREYTDVRFRVAGRAHQLCVPPFVHMCARYT